MEPNQRATYRIDYPRTERPRLRIDEDFFEVLDCSESGLRYELPKGARTPVVGSEIRGRVLFQGEGGEHDVVGSVTRVRGQAVAVRFTRSGVPYATVFAEQRRLRRTFAVQKGQTR